MSAKQNTPPAWKQAIIVNNQRKAKTTPCTRCAQTTINGLDNDTCAWAAAADPTPLTWAGELAARLNGRHTYEMSARELHRRTNDRAKQPANDPVLPQHICGQPVPATWLQPVPPPTREEATNDPPY